jgi:pyruvate dehydrogenase E1 component alpha subunit
MPGMKSGLFRSATIQKGSSSMADKHLSPSRAVELLGMMHLIREFDRTAAQLWREKLARASLHPYIGQEAVAVGVCAHLKREDYVSSNHRGHGHSLAKGTDPTEMMKELLGRAGGTCGGKGGSMHIADFSVGMLGANGVVADGATLAVGAAHGIDILGQDRISVCFFGDGAVNRGPRMEAFNWAALYRLPVLFVCEDNQFAATTRSKNVTAGGGFVARAGAFGLEGRDVDGNDLPSVFEAAGEIVERVRSKREPGYIYAQTYRHTGHSMAREHESTRDADEHARWLGRDPIVRLEAWLKEARTSADVIKAQKENAVAQIAQAAEAAKAAPWPDPAQALLEVQDIGAPK